MVKIEFIYMKNKFIIENTDNNSKIFQKYSSLINNDLSELLFLYKGKYLNIDDKLNIFNHNKIIIFVFNKNQKIKNNNEKIKEIICPECKNLSSLNIKDNLVIINNCINKHNNNFTLNSFIDSQKLINIKFIFINVKLINYSIMI